MGLMWPGFLLLLGIIPLIIGLYIWVLRRRRRFAVRYSSLALIREALPRQSNLRRHLPFALFLLAIASLILALSRPVASVAVPVGQTTVVLAMDVSRSMCATDIQPYRLHAAKQAALSFIQRQGGNVQIGVVAFAGFAELVQPPTRDQEALEAAIQSLTTGRWTAIGSAILESIDAIAEVNPDVPPVARGNEPPVSVTPVPEGQYVPDVIVLLTDGSSNAGPFPLDATQEAVDRGIRIYTIGFGTSDQGTPLGSCGEGYMGNFGFGSGPGFGGGGSRFRLGIDEETLIEIARRTGGEYYSAESAAELNDVFRSLPTYFATRIETTEISVAFTAVGALLAALAIALSMLWHPLP